MSIRRLFVATFALFLLAFSPAVAQHDHDHGTPAAEHGDHGDMHDSENLSMGAFYITIKNNGDNADKLVSIETDMAQAAEIHTVEEVDGVMQMSPMLDGLEISAGETIVFEPASYHVMLVGITESLLDGEDFTATLTFESAGEVEITVPIFALEPEEGEFGDSVEVGDIEISNVWARQAPKIGGDATPMATPDDAHEHHHD